jgi:hypothetical protein
MLKGRPESRFNQPGIAHKLFAGGGEKEGQTVLCASQTFLQ